MSGGRGKKGMGSRLFGVGGGLFRAWLGWFSVLAIAATATAQMGLGPDGAKAYQMARAADTAAVAAWDEGEATLRELQKLLTTHPEIELLRTLQDDAARAHRALVGYRRQTLAATTEALSLLAELRGTGQPDPVRRQVFEQRALLSAHEAAVMAARVRAEAERLRALHAEARAAVAASREAPRGGRATSPAVGPGQVAVPNLVGARLDAATRDLEAAGLRLGATAGPGEGFVVKQVPEAGAPVSRGTAVSVILSATAASVTVSPP